jgi:hypothetical protein
LSGANVSEKPHWYETTTAVLARRAPGLAWLPVALRKHFTPAALVSAVSAVAVCIAYVLNAQRDLSQLKVTVADQVSAQAKQFELLHELNVRLAVVNLDMLHQGEELDRLREWREQIEDIAETSPHGRRRKP